MQMQIDRRRLLLVSAAMTAMTWTAAARAADDRTALFWRVTIGKGSAIVCGYERIAASIAPDVVRDGDRFIDETTSIVLDFNPVVKFPPIQIDRKSTVPLSTVVSKQTFADLQQVFAKTPQISAVSNQLTGIEVTSLLMGEGQTPPTPSAGGVMTDHGKAFNRPVVVLIADAEAQRLWNPPDIVALNKSIDDEKIRYLLELRRQIGPIGAHLEKLYVARQSDEINRFTADIRQHGIPSPSRFMDEDKLRQMLLDRLIATLSAQDQVAAFALLPLGMLTGGDGLLAKLRTDGNAVTALA